MTEVVKPPSARAVARSAIAGGLSAKQSASGQRSGSVAPRAGGSTPPAASVFEPAPLPLLPGSAAGSRSRAASSTAVPAPREWPTTTTRAEGSSFFIAATTGVTARSNMRAAASIPACTVPRKRVPPIASANGAAAACRSVSRSSCGSGRWRRRRRAAAPSGASARAARPRDAAQSARPPPRHERRRQRGGSRAKSLRPSPWRVRTPNGRRPPGTRRLPSRAPWRGVRPRAAQRGSRRRHAASQQPRPLRHSA
mmetsp:Transcript_24303/g.57581  ORF Transcript_24303/g.57581 Transcript_24303/m.57581 type:complete len:253 (-) Transcript_24303:615-1373(-)